MTITRRLRLEVFRAAVMDALEDLDDQGCAEQCELGAILVLLVMAIDKLLAKKDGVANDPAAGGDNAPPAPFAGRG